MRLDSVMPHIRHGLSRNQLPFAAGACCLVGSHAGGSGLLRRCGIGETVNGVRAWPRWTIRKKRTGRKNPSCTAEPGSGGRSCNKIGSAFLT